MRAKCPFRWLHLAGGADTCTVATAWSRVGRTARRQMQSRDSGRHRTGKSKPREGATEVLSEAVVIRWNGMTGALLPAAIGRRREEPEG